MALVYSDPARLGAALGGGAGGRLSGLRGRLARRRRRREPSSTRASLEPTASATSVRVRNGEPVVTDGPYAEVKESLGGYYLFSCDTLEDAIGWAAKIPAAWTGGAVEIRPVHVDEEAAA